MIRTSIPRITLALAAGTTALLLAGCGSQSPSAHTTPSTGVNAPRPSSRDRLVQAQVGRAQDAVVALLKDRPSLKSDSLTRELLATVGYHVTKQAEVWFEFGHGRYCIWGVDPKKDGPYGITATHVWVADDTNTTVRAAPVDKQSGFPAFDTLQNGKHVLYPGTCGHGGDGALSVAP